MFYGAKDVLCFSWFFLLQHCLQAACRRSRWAVAGKEMELITGGVTRRFHTRTKKQAGELRNDSCALVGWNLREHNKLQYVRRMDYALSKMWVYLF